MWAPVVSRGEVKPAFKIDHHALHLGSKFSVHCHTPSGAGQSLLENANHRGFLGSLLKRDHSLTNRIKKITSSWFSALKHILEFCEAC
jgi:hypothetical protein